MILSNLIVKNLVQEKSLASNVVAIMDDFRSPVVDGSNVFSEITLTEKSTNSATLAAITGIGGGLLASLTSDSEAQAAGVETAKVIDASSDCVFQSKIIVSTALTSGSQVVVGLIDATPAGAVANKAGAMFTIDSDLVLDVSTDDDTTDNDPATTGKTLVVDTEYRLGIDLRDTSDVKFYLDGQRLNADTKYDMSAISSSNLMIATAQIDKASGTSTGAIKIKQLEVAHTV